MLTVGISLNIAVFRFLYINMPNSDPPKTIVMAQQATIINIRFSLVSFGGGAT